MQEASQADILGPHRIPILSQACDGSPDTPYIEYIERDTHMI